MTYSTHKSLSNGGLQCLWKFSNTRKKYYLLSLFAKFDSKWKLASLQSMHCLQIQSTKTLQLVVYKDLLEATFYNKQHCRIAKTVRNKKKLFIFCFFFLFVCLCYICEFRLVLFDHITYSTKVGLTTSRGTGTIFQQTLQ